MSLTGPKSMRKVDEPILSFIDVYVIVRLLIMFHYTLTLSIFIGRPNHFTHVRWGPCPHSMARPRVADGGTASSYGG
jgi:hypothetical protein